MADRTTPAETNLGRLPAGYPDGIPPHDDIALLGVLHRSLTENAAAGASSGVGRD